MTSTKISEVLSGHGWTCSEQEFGRILQARFQTISRTGIIGVGPDYFGHPRTYCAKNSYEVQENEDSPSLPNTEKVTPVPQAHMEVQTIPREKWGPRRESAFCYINDSAIPSFLQSTLPAQLPDIGEQSSLEILRDRLRATYRERVIGSSLGTWIQIHSVDEGDHLERFRFLGVEFLNNRLLAEVGEWRPRVHLFMGPLPASPTRARTQADCFEDMEVYEEAIMEPLPSFLPDHIA